MRFNTRRLAKALGLLSVAIVSFGIAGATWSDPTAPGCTRPDSSDKAIRECVAAKARATEPSAGALVALAMGAVTLTASVAAAARATRRVMTIAEAARELQIRPSELCRLVDAGVLQIYDHETGTMYLHPEQVHRLAAQGS